MARYYSADEAAKRLGISLNTLYAYVSRGLLRSEPVSHEKRTRRYHAQDVEKLARRSKGHKAPGTTGPKPPNGSPPLVETAITCIADTDFFYRGQSVLTLADKGSLEEAVAILWGPGDRHPNRPDAYAYDLVEEALRLAPKGQLPVETFLSLLLTLSNRDVRAFDFSPTATAQAGIVMMDGLARILTGHWRKKSLSAHLAGHWSAEPSLPKLLDAALILVADHELDMPTFVARATASADCSAYAAVAAATHIFFGRRHGGGMERVYGLLSEADQQNNLYEVIVSRLRRGDPIPGFGHHLHAIDPRADYLLHALPDRQGYIKQALTASQELLKGTHPNIDLALVLLEREFCLPGKTGVYLFYLGRMAGWVAHIMEQHVHGQPLHPRTRYVGAAPHGSEGPHSLLP
jgi:citrate synthase